VRAGTELLPPIKVQAEKDRLEEEREALEGERHPDDRSGSLHEAWPQQAELEREHRAGDRAHGEENGRASRPPFSEIQVLWPAGA
jgi:hypothetical protein